MCVQIIKQKISKSLKHKYSINFKHHFISKIHKQDQCCSIRQSSNINNHSRQRTQNLIVTVYGYHLQIINKTLFFLHVQTRTYFFLIVKKKSLDKHFITTPSTYNHLHLQYFFFILRIIIVHEKSEWTGGRCTCLSPHGCYVALMPRSKPSYRPQPLAAT